MNLERERERDRERERMTTKFSILYTWPRFVVVVTLDL